MTDLPLTAMEYMKQRNALAMALSQIKIVCIDNKATTVRHDLALEFVGGIAERALAAHSQSPQDMKHD